MADMNFVPLKVAANKLGVSKAWLYKRVGIGKGPPFYRRGKMILFRLDELEQYMFQRLVD